MDSLGEVWWLAGLGAVVVGTTAVVCRACLLRDVAYIGRKWAAIRPLLQERCELVNTLSEHMRTLARASPRMVDDIHYLLTQLDETTDPYKHAGVQNGLVLTVQRGLEEYHGSEEFRSPPGISEAMQGISVVDSRLAPLRDSYNKRVERYNTRLKGTPFSVVARVMGAKERATFPMLIPWWSTDQVAYGGVSAEDIKQVLETWKAPMIVAPSQLAMGGNGGGDARKSA